MMKRTHVVRQVHQEKELRRQEAVGQPATLATSSQLHIASGQTGWQTFKVTERYLCLYLSC